MTQATFLKSFEVIESVIVILVFGVEPPDTLTQPF